MITFLFWNLNRKPLGNAVANIVNRNDVDVVLLAECVVPPVEMLKALTSSAQVPFFVAQSECDKIVIYSRLSKRFFSPLTESVRFTIQSLSLPLRPGLLLGVVHLPSQLYFSRESLAMESQQFMRDLLEAETRAGQKRTILVGDFNMNPFDEGVVSAGAIHGVMTRAIASKGSRTVQGREFPFFYNPMWSHFGDGKPGPAGTYYSERSEHVNFFWNMFDQVLLRPQLLPYFSSEDLKILTTDGNSSLLSSDGLPDRSWASDHLPILFRLNI